MKSLVPRLSRRAWIVLSGDAVSALGNGLILPFVVIYLRDVRGFPIEHVGLVLSMQAIAGLLTAPLSGWLIDHIGARRALMLALTTAAVASASAIFVDRLWEAFAWAMLLGAGIAMMWPAALSLMAGVVPKERRSAVFSVHFALLNAGIGVGAMVGGFLVDIDHPETFNRIFLIDAASFLVYVGVLWKFVDRDVRPEGGEHDAGRAASWRRVFADRAFVRILALSVGLITIGYAQLQSSFPAFATSRGEIGTKALGGVFAVNTAVIVATQLLVLSRLTGARRSRALAAVGVLWAASWVVTAAAGLSGGGLVAVLAFMLASGVFAFGETFMQAALPALVNDLAPDEIRGRYNAAYSVTWSVGNIAGPPIGGFLLGAGRGTELFLLLAVACIAAAAYAIRLERFIPSSARRFGGGPVEELAPVPAS